MIVRSLTVLDENLGISTIAEGAERIAQFTQLRRQGRSQGAGPLHQPDGPAADIEALWQQLAMDRPEAGLPLPRNAAKQLPRAHRVFFLVG